MAAIEDFIDLEQQDDVVILWLHNKQDKMNKVSPEMLDHFTTLIDQLDKDDKVKAAVIASKKKDFIAGVDLKFFQSIKKAGDFKPFAIRAHALLNRIEASKKPIVSAIHGSCVGAGTEISLCCHGRIAADNKRTFLALPEIKIGLFPGGGGSQRLPRLIGIQNALPIMLTGKNVYAAKALKLGLVDQLAPDNMLIEKAIEMARSLIKNPIKRESKLSLKDRLLESTGIGRNIIFKEARKSVDRQTQGNYPAPYKLLDCVETGYKKGIKAGLDAEIEHFEALLLTPECRALTHLFFAMTGKKKNPYDASLVKPIHNLAMIGAGFMGAGITEVSINKEINVLLKDVKQETLDKAMRSIKKSFDKKVEKKALEKTKAEFIQKRISPQLDYNGFDKADIVVEAVFEDLKLKQKIIQETEAQTKPDCIFASNTSALPISKIADASQRPETVIGLHYFSPVPKMPLLEIVVTDKTADWVTATCFELGIRQGKTNIVVKDGPGFYTTRILAPLLNETMLTLEDGADALKIDKALQKFGFPVGPVTLIDEVGIDVGAHIMQGQLMQEYNKRSGASVSQALIQMAEKDYAGRKSKKGFYQYDEKGKKRHGMLDENLYSFFGGEQRKAFDTKELQQRISAAMIKEALLCLEEGIISTPLDGDLGAVFGLGFPPFTGGPFRYIDQIGPKTMFDQLNDLSSKFGERFAPPTILADMVEQKKHFYETV